MIGLGHYQWSLIVALEHLGSWSTCVQCTEFLASVAMDSISPSLHRQPRGTKRFCFLGLRINPQSWPIFQNGSTFCLPLWDEPFLGNVPVLPIPKASCCEGLMEIHLKQPPHSGLLGTNYQSVPCVANVSSLIQKHCSLYLESGNLYPGRKWIPTL